MDQVLYFLICQEKHKDDTDHLHAYVKFIDGVTAKNKLLFDFEFDEKIYHGNYQATRSPKAVINYVTKKDDYISNFNVKQYQDKKGKTPVTVKTLKKKSVQQALTDGDISFHQARQYQFARQLVEEPYNHHTV